MQETKHLIAETLAFYKNAQLLLELIYVSKEEKITLQVGKTQVAHSGRMSELCSLLVPFNTFIAPPLNIKHQHLLLSSLDYVLKISVVTR